jgi:hypothetical protein
MNLGFERKKTSPWMSNIFEKHNAWISTESQSVDIGFWRK